MTFSLDGVELVADYDDEADILYLWVGDGPRPAVAHEDPDGHLIQLDPETRQFLGVAIVDYEAGWGTGDPIKIHVPVVEERTLEAVRYVSSIPSGSRAGRVRSGR